MSLGVMNYDFGYFPEVRRKNLQEALAWYRRAAAQGEVDAQFPLATAYESGIGVPQDYIEHTNGITSPRHPRNTKICVIILGSCGMNWLTE
jgi:TPR repeat protein